MFPGQIVDQLDEAQLFVHSRKPQGSTIRKFSTLISKKFRMIKQKLQTMFQINSPKKKRKKMKKKINRGPTKYRINALKRSNTMYFLLL